MPAIPGPKLVAVVDADEARARAIAEEFGAEAVTDHRDLPDRVDAVSIAVPTPLHFDVARDLIEAGLHVLIEKPITDSVESAKTITALAEQRGTVLQVGHIERYSAAYRVISEMIDQPLYLESYRIAPWKTRGVEVDVILDLMIHDIDMIIGLVGSPVTSVDAVGTPLLGPQDRHRQRADQLRVRMRRQCHGEPGKLQDGASAQGLRAQQLSQLRSRRAQDLRLQPARRSEDARLGGDRHRDASKFRKRTVSATRSLRSSPAWRPAASRSSTAMRVRRRCASR